MRGAADRSNAPRAAAKRRWRKSVAFALLAGLAACGGRIWLDHADPQGVELHWYTRAASIDEASGRANRHCQSWGKRAVLLDEFEDQDVTTAHFACR